MRTGKNLNLNQNIIAIAMLMGAAAAIFLGNLSVLAVECETAEQNLFRLHILANSDSFEDQEMKYALRDYLLTDAEITGLFQSSNSSHESRQIAEDNLALIERKAGAFLSEKNAGYTAKAETARMYFTTRVYDGDTTLPAGEYDALRIVLGRGAGQNWWCVLFPPLCLPAASELQTQRTQPVFTRYDSRRIESGQNRVQIKFAIYEAIKNFLSG